MALSVRIDGVDLNEKTIPSMTRKAIDRMVPLVASAQGNTITLPVEDVIMVLSAAISLCEFSEGESKA